jgi:hypothetical protein
VGRQLIALCTFSCLSLESDNLTRNCRPQGPNAPYQVVEAKHIISSLANRRNVGCPSISLQGRRIG